MKTEIESTIKRYFEEFQYDFYEASFHTLESLPYSQKGIEVEKIITDNAAGYVMVVNKSLNVPHICITKQFIYVWKHSEILSYVNLHLYTVHKNESYI